MKDEYIEVVKKWLADHDSVSVEELEQNAENARIAADVNEGTPSAKASYYVMVASAAAVDCITSDPDDLSEAGYWARGAANAVKKYEEVA